MKIRIIVLTFFTLFFSCKDDYKEGYNAGCLEGCKSAYEDILQEEFVNVAGNLGEENKYLPSKKLKEDVIFNVNLRNVDLQPVHIDFCSQRAFVILADFKGEIGSEYESEKVTLRIRNEYSVDKTFYKVKRVEELAPSSVNGKKYVNLKVFLEKTSERHQIIGIPIALKKLKKFKKNTGLDLTLWVEENGEEKKYLGCGITETELEKHRKLEKKQVKFDDYVDFGGHACKGNMSY